MSKNLALLVIDMQAGLLQQDVYKRANIIDNINFLIKHFNGLKLPIIVVRHTNKSFSQINTDAWQIDNCIKLTGTETLFNKYHSSVFKENKFTEMLNEKGIEAIAVCGLVSNGCVQAACLDGVKHALKVYLISDAHSTWHKDAEKVITNWNNKLQLAGIACIPSQSINTIT